MVSDFTAVRGKLPDRIVLALSLLATLYLVAALTLSASFLIAKSVIAAQYGNSLANHSQVQFGDDAGDGRDPLSWSGPKRLRGTLEAKVSVGEILDYFVAPQSSMLWMENPNLDRKPASLEPEPRDHSLPQELLGRPPPIA